MDNHENCVSMNRIQNDINLLSLVDNLDKIIEQESFIEFNSWRIRLMNEIIHSTKNENPNSIVNVKTCLNLIKNIKNDIGEQSQENYQLLILEDLKIKIEKSMGEKCETSNKKVDKNQKKKIRVSH